MGEGQAGGPDAVEIHWSCAEQMLYARRTPPEQKASSLPRAEPHFLKTWGHAEKTGTRNVGGGVGVL